MKTCHKTVQNEKKNSVQKRRPVGDAVQKGVGNAVMGKNPSSGNKKPLRKNKQRAKYRHRDDYPPLERKEKLFDRLGFVEILRKQAFEKMEKAWFERFE